MIISIHQPQYIPWLGYFDKIIKSDIFIFLDDVQYKKNEWQNRNKIRNAKNWQWLTVPVKYRFPQKINEVEIDNSKEWKKDHLLGIINNYSKSEFFKKYIDFFDDLYHKDWKILSDLNIYIIENILKFIGVEIQLLKSSDICGIIGSGSERLLSICSWVGADCYLSGVGGKDYLNVDIFENNNINVRFQEFLHPQYKQNFGGFESGMSIIDLLFNHGDNSINILNNKNI